MLKQQHDLYQHPVMIRLAAAERAVMAARIRSCAGPHALHLTAFADDAPPSLPLLPHWVSLQITASGCHGELRLDAAMPLPFIEESFDVIWLKHALDRHPHPAQLLASSVRLLAPGGTLLVSGLHPFGGWAPWWWLRGGAGTQLHAPWLLQLALRLSGLPVFGQWRQGSSWPRAGADQERRNRLGGAYMLIVKKERAQILPFVTRLVARRRADSGQLGAVQAASAHSWDPRVDVNPALRRVNSP
ncbi:class I SAM-dependent methyltransferase [Frateuria aurantia]